MTHISPHCRLSLWLSRSLLAAGLRSGSAARRRRPTPDPVNFGSTDNVLDLKPCAARPITRPAAAGGRWFVLVHLQVSNDARAPRHAACCWRASRRAPRCRFCRAARGPPSWRWPVRIPAPWWKPRTAYGRRAWRVIVPPVTTVGLAIRVGSADTPPALFGLDRAGAVLPQPPACHLHHRRGRPDRRGGADHRRPCRPDRPCRAALGGADPAAAAARAGCRAPACSMPAWRPGSAGLMACRRFLTALALAAGARLADAIIPMRDIWPRTREAVSTAPSGA